MLKAKSFWLLMSLLSCLSTTAPAAVNIYVSSTAPVGLQEGFIAQTTAQYNAKVVKSIFPNTYNLTLYKLNPGYQPPVISTTVTNLNTIADKLVKISSDTYLYGAAYGVDIGRQIALDRMSYYIVRCASPTVFGAGISTAAWNQAVCTGALMAASSDVYYTQFSTPPILNAP